MIIFAFSGRTDRISRSVKAGFGTDATVADVGDPEHLFLSRSPFAFSRPFKKHFFERLSSDRFRKVVVLQCSVSACLSEASVANRMRLVIATSVFVAQFEVTKWESTYIGS